MRKKRLLIVSIVILVGLLLLSELVIWSSGRIGLINTTSRIISNAPDIEIQGKRLSYQGTVSFEDNQHLEKYASSDDGEVLYKATGTPVQPPWIYVEKDGNTFFRYKIPQIPWRM
ncbi:MULTISPECIES: hypothetical protein [Paenibacillus]|uniref:Uncharacterized protein n=1 Tax=Paenibacillus xylanilyticus TaxID=248903 RepID=A0A7Y6C0Q3_9BACL|nr:hypothetical protein [Paenibacillus xylanilyticus]NUU77660.1 hypothetical protein [Paenibacillus xylanilyticus]